MCIQWPDCLLNMKGTGNTEISKTWELRATSYSINSQAVIYNFIKVFHTVFGPAPTVIL